MTTYRTNNPLGSKDPRDLYDNAENFDAAMNSEAASFDDRFGKSRMTWSEAERRANLQIGRATQAAEDAIAAAGAIGPIKFYDTLAQAQADIANLAAGDLIEIAADESRDGARTRYKKSGSSLSFVVNIDQLRIDFTQPRGSEPAGGFGSYSDLRNYSGGATKSKFIGENISGDVFLDLLDNASEDNGIDIFVDARGGRWKRKINGAIYASWAGVSKTNPENHILLNKLTARAAELGVFAVLDIPEGIDISGPLEWDWRHSLIAPVLTGITAKAPMPAMLKNARPDVPLQFTQAQNLYFDCAGLASQGCDVKGLQWPEWTNVHFVNAINEAWSVDAAGTETSQWGTMTQCFGTDSGKGGRISANAFVWNGGAFNRNSGDGLHVLGEAQKFVGTDASANNIGIIFEGPGHGFYGYQELNNLDVWAKPNSIGCVARRHLASVSGSVIDQGEDNDFQFDGGGSSQSALQNFIRGGFLDKDWSAFSTLPPALRFTSNGVNGHPVLNWWTGLTTYKQGKSIVMVKPQGIDYGGFEIDLDYIAKDVAGKKVVLGIEISGSVNNASIDTTGKHIGGTINCHTADGTLIKTISWSMTGVDSSDIVLKEGGVSRLAMAPDTVPINCERLRVRVFFANNISDEVTIALHKIIINSGSTPSFSSGVSDVADTTVIYDSPDADYSPLPAKKHLVRYSTVTGTKTVTPPPNALEGDEFIVHRSPAGGGVLNVVGGKVAEPNSWQQLLFTNGSWAFKSCGTFA